MVFNTGETSEDLRNKYNPDGSLLRKAQLRMLDMLIYIDKICRQEKIPYRISGGNVLGAIRHNGFIPWDDDIDIVLLREDCRRLCRYLKKHPHPQYVIQTFGTDYGYVGAWPILRDIKSEYIQDDRVHNARKYRGLQVDIFPCENKIVPIFHKISALVTVKNNNWFVGRCMFLSRIIHLFQFCLLHPIFRFIGFFVGNKNVYMHSYGAMLGARHTSKALYPLKPIKFEGYEFSGPASPDLYCKEHYGENYMNLPKEDSRNHHQATYIIED